MFPLTHLYVLRKIKSNPDDLAVLGSIFPDTVISNEISWDETHIKGWEFFNNLNESQAEQLKSFLFGFFSHTITPEGVDFYGDKDYLNTGEGYSFKKAHLIADQVQIVCKLSPEHSLWKAHNFIEMGVETLIFKENQDLRKELASALNNKLAIDKISLELSKFYKTSTDNVKRGFFGFLDFVSDHPVNSCTLAEKYTRQLQHKHNITGIDKVKVVELIDISKEIVALDYHNFIDFCCEKLKVNLPLWLSK